MAALRFGSLFSGVEAASLAWVPLGMEPAFYAEVDPFCCELLKQRHPGVPNLGDVNAGDFAERAKALGPIDVLVGGSPCQSFSTAGKRGGFADARGNLTLRYYQIVEELRPAWLVWENVPGVLSQDGGRAFGAVLGRVEELGYGWAYRVLDARFFGVPQRRRRVFVVGRLGDAKRAAAVLFEQEGEGRNLAAGRAAWEGAPGTAASSPGGVRVFRDSGTQCWAEGVGQVKASTGSEPTGAGLVVAAFGGNRTAGEIDAATSLSVKNRLDFESDTLVVCATGGQTHALTSIGGDASEDGTGQGTPVVAIDLRQASRGDKDTNNRPGGSSGGPTGTGIADAGDPAFTVSSRGQAVAFTQNQRDEVRLIGGDGQTAGSLSSDSGMKQTNYIASAVAFTEPGRKDGAETECQEELAYCLRNSGEGGRSTDRQVAYEAGRTYHVRRLTPRECERLMGFPDDYTLVNYRGKPAKDAPRYRAIGNSMVVNVMAWIGVGLLQAHKEDS